MFKQSLEFPIAAISCNYVQPWSIYSMLGDSLTCRDLINGGIDS